MPPPPLVAPDRAAPALAAKDTRAQIRAVALELFSRQGYSGTSLREVADRMGFSKAALYYHYTAKEQLARDLLAPLLDDLDALLDEVATPATGARRRAFLRDYALLVLRHRDLVRFAYSDLSVIAHTDLGPRVQAQAERVVGVVQPAGGAAEAQARAAFALSGMQLALTAVPLGDGAPDPGLVDLVTDLAATALGVPGRRRARS